MRSFDVVERRARLARRHHLSPAHRAAGVVEACEAMVGLHGTDPASVYLAGWARVDGLTVAAVDRALYADRVLVKHLCMRRTLFVVHHGLFGVVQAAAGQRVAEQERARLVKEVEKAGLVKDGGAWLEAASRETLRALEEMGAATAAQLRSRVGLLDHSIVYAPDKAYSQTGSLAPRVLTTLSAAGKVVRGTNGANWYSSRPAWSTTARWLGQEPPRPPEAQARAELVRRWLTAFGPASTLDLRWWLGSTVTAVRAALADAGAVEVDVHGQPGVALADDLDPVEPVAPYAALLPGLDPTTMGWFERDWYLGPHRPQVFDSNGNAGMTAWWDGRVVGGWNQAASGEVVLQLLEDVGAEGAAALEGEAGRLTGWLDGVRVAPRFPSPLSKSAAWP